MTRTAVRHNVITRDDRNAQLDEATEIDRLSLEWFASARAADVAARERDALAWMYADAKRRSPTDPIVDELHRHMLNAAERAERGPELLGAEASDRREETRVLVALNRGKRVRSATVLARAAAALSADDRNAARAILAAPSDAPDGGVRDRIRESGLVSRWLDDVRRHLRIAEGLITRGEADPTEAERYCERLRKLIRLHERRR